MYKLFNRTTGICDTHKEPELVIEKDETLYCAPRGQVCTLDSRPVYSFTKELSQELAAQRRKRIPLKMLKRDIAKVLGFRGSTAFQTGKVVPEYRIMRNWRSRKFPKPRWTTYLVETEPGIQTIVYRLGDEQLLSRPPKGQKRAILYISHQSSDAELRAEPLIKELIEAEPDSAVYTCDVRGIGESQPDTCNENSYLSVYGSDYFYAIHSIMLGKPYPSQRTRDILRVLQWLKSHGHDEVHLVARGWGTIPATFAAVLSDQVKQVTLKNALTSYSDIAESETYSWPLSALVPNILKSFDLPDCYKALKRKNLKQIDPWGPNGQ